MEVKFIGTGSAFNTAFGNTSAYIKNKESVLLIDCGSLVFHQLKERQLLQNLQHLYIAITHTHPDHVASLGEVIFYCYYILKIKVKVIYREQEVIRQLLRLMGATDEMYTLSSERVVHIKDKNLGDLTLETQEVNHVETMKAYSFYIGYDNTLIYYSGDASNLPEKVVEQLAKGEISRIYQDTCGIDYVGNPHYYIGKLEQQIPKSLRSKVYCMHLDTHLREEEIAEKGFQVAK